MKPLLIAKSIKLLLIPLLLGTLYFVLPSKRKTPESESTVASAVSSVRNELNPAVDTCSVGIKIDWPMISSSELENLDPFDRGMLFPELPSPNALSYKDGVDQQVLVSVGGSEDKTVETKIQAVFHSRVGIAAMVGDRVVHVGDQLADGRLVVGITAEQLILAPTTTNSLH